MSQVSPYFLESSLFCLFYSLAYSCALSNFFSLLLSLFFLLSLLLLFFLFFLPSIFLLPKLSLLALAAATISDFLKTVPDFRGLFGESDPFTLALALCDPLADAPDALIVAPSAAAVLDPLIDAEDDPRLGAAVPDARATEVFFASLDRRGVPCSGMVTSSASISDIVTFDFGDVDFSASISDVDTFDFGDVDFSASAKCAADDDIFRSSFFPPSDGLVASNSDAEDSLTTIAETAFFWNSFTSCPARGVIPSSSGDTPWAKTPSSRPQKESGVFPFRGPRTSCVL